MTNDTLTNVLGQSASPYLRQHQDNPVHWQIWGETALNEARRTGKPILLSIGYAACHWCHVMAHESFGDQATADVMNDLFINIKVDREERSDIDQIYMAALHAMGEQGGWPLTMFLNAESEPFWGGTYFPRVPTYGRPDFISVLRSISAVYQSEPDKVTRNAHHIREHLDKTLAVNASPDTPTNDILNRQAKSILSIVDQVNGGIGQSPKFPNASMLETLWRHWRATGSQVSRQAALQWIRVLINGGIYDHLGGGLSRYCVDSIWLAPHFEKMLYDNAQLLRALLWALEETGELLFRNRIEETIEWLKREMLMEGGGFASSLDADSEGEEGRFYVWQKAEIDHLLGKDAELFCTTYDVSQTGNWEHSNILNRLKTPEPLGVSEEQRLAENRKTLLDARSHRIRPDRDDKILADWNGLLIRALAEAGHRMDRSDWVTMARNAYDFVTESMMRDNRLAHAWCRGVTTYPALASDYGAMINASLSLYQATLDTSYVNQAEVWVNILDRHYSDGEGSYFYTADDTNDILLRARHEHDDATPSATAQVLESLARLSQISQSEHLVEKANTMAAGLWGRINPIAMAASGGVNAIHSVLQPVKLVLVNPAKDMLDTIRTNPDPARMDIVLESNQGAEALIPDRSIYETGKQTGSAAYLCYGPQCLPPIFNARELDAALKAERP